MGIVEATVAGIGLLLAGAVARYHAGKMWRALVRELDTPKEKKPSIEDHIERAMKRQRVEVANLEDELARIRTEQLKILNKKINITHERLSNDGLDVSLPPAEIYMDENGWIDTIYPEDWYKVENTPDPPITKVLDLDAGEWGYCKPWAVEVTLDRGGNETPYIAPEAAVDPKPWGTSIVVGKGWDHEIYLDISVQGDGKAHRWDVKTEVPPGQWMIVSRVYKDGNMLWTSERS